MSRCILCQDPDAPDRLSGFDLCGRCHAGIGVEARLEALGMGTEHRRWTERRRSGNSGSHSTYQMLEISLHLTRWPDARAHFGRGPTEAHTPGPAPEGAGAWERLMHWLAPGDLQVGDSLFDDAVFVSEPEGEDLRALLADTGVQSAVMELVSRGGVRLGEGWLRCRRGHTEEPPDLGQNLLPMALFALHLQVH